jgi:hypothetical protein
MIHQDQKSWETGYFDGLNGSPSCPQGLGIEILRSRLPPDTKQAEACSSSTCRVERP